jgi:hypothetical protein
MVPCAINNDSLFAVPQQQTPPQTGKWVMAQMPQHLWLIAINLTLYYLHLLNS